MRIIQIGSTLTGAQKEIEEAIHCSAIAHGDESLILFACGMPSMPCELCYESKVENLITRGLRKYVTKSSHCSVLQTIRLIRHIKRFKPDIVHLHILHHGYTDYELLLRYLGKLKIPVVYTMHDMWAFTGGCYHYSEVKCNGYKKGCDNCPAEKSDLDVERNKTSQSYYKKKRLLKTMDRLYIVTVSNWVKQELQESFFADYPITVISNGMKYDTNFDCLKKIKSKKYKSLLSVATSWTLRKGIYLLMELAQELGPEYRIKLIGSVSEEIKKRAPSNISFLGYCNNRRELFQYYNESDLYVSASQEETFGMTFVEAAFMGTRSVGYNSTAISETLAMVHGNTVDEYSAKAFASAIRELFMRKNLKLSEKQVAEVRRQFSSERMSDDYLNLYSRILNGD